MSLNIPSAEAYAALPDELFVVGADDSLSEEIARRFGVEPPKVGITLPKTEGDPGSIRVTLAKSDGKLADKIAAWLKSESSADVTVLTAEETG